MQAASGQTLDQNDSFVNNASYPCVNGGPGIIHSRNLVSLFINKEQIVNVQNTYIQGTSQEIINTLDLGNYTSLVMNGIQNLFISDSLKTGANTSFTIGENYLGQFDLEFGMQTDLDPNT